MAFPIIPFLFGGGIFAGLLGLAWYDSLPPEKRREADRKAAELAYSTYERALDQLTQSELKFVYDNVKKLMSC